MTCRSRETCGTLRRDARSRGRPSPARRPTCSTQGDIDAGVVNNSADVRARARWGPRDPLDDATATDTESVTIPQQPSLALDKSSRNGPYDHVGQVLTYTYTLTNTGNVTLGGPFDITDDKAPNAACTDSTIAPGALDHLHRQLRRDPGRPRWRVGHEHRDRCRNVRGRRRSRPTRDSVTILADQKPALSLVKTRHPGRATTRRARPSTTRTRQEHRQRHAVGAGHRDRRQRLRARRAYQGGDANSNGKLDVGETWTFTAEHDVTQDDLDFGSVTNHATGHAVFNATTYDSNTATVTVPAIQNPSLDLTKAVTEDDVHRRRPDPPLHVRPDERRQRDPHGREHHRRQHRRCIRPTSRGTPTATASSTSTRRGHFAATHTTTLAEVYAGSITNNATGHATFKSAPVTSNSPRRRSAPPRPT